MEIIISVFIGYLLGSIPTAFLLLKKTRNIDITKNGSNNVGALNSYEVSNSKFIGLSVLLIDALKGAASVLLVQFLFGNSFLFIMLSLTSAVLAHCYSPWIKFKGGRGLAATAGGILLVEPIILVLWVLFWLVTYVFKRHIHFSNVLASVLTAVISITSADILNSVKWFTSPPAETNFIFAAFNIALFLIIISRHLTFIKEYFTAGKNKLKESKYE